jgi:hypothetical protein
MDESPISNPFDEYDKKRNQTSRASDTSQLDADTGSRPLAWMILGVGVVGCCLMAAVAFYYFRPDMQTIYAEYFPSPTAGTTSTPSTTPTPNLTATQRVAAVTGTARAIENLIAEAGTEWNISISETFDNVGDNWPTGTDEDEYATILRRGVDRAYQWDATSKQGFISWISAHDAPVTDFRLSVEARQVSGTDSSDYGVAFREDSDGNFYYFGVTGDGFFVSAYHRDEWIDVVEFTYSSTVKDGDRNKITVIASGSFFIFLINDFIVAEAVDERIPSGTTALAIQIYEAGLQAVMEFDNFELRTP